MQDTFSLFEYLRYLNDQRRWLGVSVAAASAVALAVSLLLPAQYTAVARLIVEPPAGADARAPQVVTPQYLESLRTFESLATSDSLFERAVERFGLRRLKPGLTIESWKKKALRAELVRNTKVLEIAITLPDARVAHQMAQFVAEETITLSRDLHRTADSEMIADAEKELAAAQESAAQAEAQWSRAARAEDSEALQARIDSYELQQHRIERRLLDARVSQANSSGSSSAENRVKLLEAEREKLAGALTKLYNRFAAHQEHMRPLDENRKAGRARLEDARKRLGESKNLAGYRGERLRMIDAGIVPERPSSPNLVLNVAGAAFFALVVSLLYFSLRFGVIGDRSQP